MREAVDQSKALENNTFLTKQKKQNKRHFDEINFVLQKSKHTVKLGYNELGYNEHPVITNKIKSNGWFQSV